MSDEDLTELEASAVLRDFFAAPGQELGIQRDMEKRWESQVQAMVPSCLNATDAFLTLGDRLAVAVRAVGGASVSFDVNIPPHHETSLDSIVNDVARTGDGR